MFYFSYLNVLKSVILEMCTGTHPLSFVKNDFLNHVIYIYTLPFFFVHPKFMRYNFNVRRMSEMYYKSGLSIYTQS